MQKSHRSFPAAQRGFSLFSLIFFGVIIALLVVVGARVAPTVTEYMTINKAVKKAAADGSTPAEIRASFDRTASVDYFDAIEGRDLDISKNGDRVVVSFAYEKEIALFGSAFLLLKYRGSSDRR